MYVYFELLSLRQKCHVISYLLAQVHVPIVLSTDEEDTFSKKELQYSQSSKQSASLKLQG